MKTVILNTDDANWKNIIIDLENTYLITYGLGSKATVTASSIECSNEVCFLYCLQRSLTGFNNEAIEPMEVPVTIKSPGQYNVYNGLAAITTSLLCGIPSDFVISSLNSRINSVGLKILYENSFGVVDNVCDTMLSFESGFEAIQNMPYENIYLVFDLPDSNPSYINKKIIDIIGAWSLTLKISNIYFFSERKDKSVLDGLYYLKSNLCNIVCLEGSLSDIEGIIYSLKSGDMLLFFCSSSYNIIREKIVETLDTKILGRLS
jgi:UDP-N-acetylmuramoyl-L-alanyl-D-glutamate--2,6-diaminopimelate ligase